MSTWTVNDQARINAQIAHQLQTPAPGGAPRALQAPAPQIRRAPAGGCQFLVNADGVQAECGRQATREGIGRNPLLYCDDHAAHLHPHTRPINP